MDEIRIGETGLTAALRALAAEDAVGTGASTEVQRRLQDEVRSLRHEQYRSLVRPSIMAAVLCITVAMPNLHLLMRRVGSKPSPAPPVARRPPEGEVATAFFPLLYSTVPMSGGRLVRLELSAEAASGLGLVDDASNPGSASRLILADVIVGDDGLARAVRFVLPITRDDARKEVEP